jgi:hypothetical protein
VRTDIGSVTRRREVAVEGIKDHLKTNEKDNKKWAEMTPEQKAAHTEKHKSQLKVLEERIRSRARARRYIDREPHTGLHPERVVETGPEDEVNNG